MALRENNLSVLMFISEDWYFWSHRKDLMVALCGRGFKVTIATRIGNLAMKLAATSLTIKTMPFRRSLASPLADLYCSGKIAYLVWKSDARIVHLVAMKPVLLSCLAVMCFRRKRFVHALAGLGYMFTSKTSRALTIRLITTKMLKFIFNRKNSFILVQNIDDRNILENELNVPSNRIYLIPGSGVDINHYLPCGERAGKTSAILVVLPARVLVEKGCLEFLAAAKKLKKFRENCRFAIVGGIDIQNPGHIKEFDIQQLVNDADVEWWGHQDDMRDVYQQADIVCLPSYREGLPKSLLEAAACGKPLVATEVSGCKDICIHELTGLLVKPKNIDSLVDGIARLIDNPQLRAEYGANARSLVERNFALDVVMHRTEKFYKEISEAALG